jgi:hypothetical protein
LKKVKKNKKSGKFKRSILFYCVCLKRIEKYIERKRERLKKEIDIYILYPFYFFELQSPKLRARVIKIYKNSIQAFER